MTPVPVLRAQLVDYARRLHAAGWVANHDGNASVRLPGDRVLITPTAISKRDTEDAGLVTVSLEGKVLEGRRKPPSELGLHLAAYRARPEIRAVLHAHPPIATAFGVAGVSLEVNVLPEIVVSLGAGVPTVPFAMPKSKASEEGVFTVAAERDAMLLAGNGALTIGVDLEQAFLRLELLEHLAKIVKAARELGGLRELGATQVAELLKARAAAGLGPKRG